MQQQPQDTVDMDTIGPDDLASLPPGVYALIAFTRWVDTGDGSQEADTFDLEWAEALQEGTAVVIPNLSPEALPGVFEGFSNAMEMGAAVVGKVMETEEEYDQFCSCVGLQVLTMDDLIRYQTMGASHVKH